MDPHPLERAGRGAQAWEAANARRLRRDRWEDALHAALGWVLAALIAAALALVAWILATSPVWAHGWYSHDCCDDRDCAPLAPGTVVATPEGWRVTLGPGAHPLAVAPLTVVLPYDDFRVHPSQDGAFHGCVVTGYPDWSGPGLSPAQELRCLYVPEMGS